MRILLTVAAILICCCSPRASGSGFELGSGVQITNGISRVTFNLDKGFRVRPAGRQVGLIEIQLTYTNGVTKRTSLISAGSLQMKAPLTVEMVEILGVVLLLLLLAATALLISSASRIGHTELNAKSNCENLIEPDLDNSASEKRHKFASEDLVGSFRLGGKPATNQQAREKL